VYIIPEYRTVVTPALPTQSRKFSVIPAKTGEPKPISLEKLVKPPSQNFERYLRDRRRSKLGTSLPANQFEDSDETLI
jgi:hypothetical protein